MDFTLSEEQELLRQSARRLLTNECPPTLVRAHVTDRAAAAPLWGHLCEWTELGDGPLVDLCLFLEETGAVCAPGPLFASTVLWAPLARAVGLSEPSIGTVAMAGASGEWIANDEPVKTFVLDADLVERVAFVVGSPFAPRVGIAPAGGLAMRPLRTVDTSRPVFDVDVPDDLATVEVGPDEVLDVLERAWVGLAAEMLGTTRWLFERTLEYAKQREQFDRPIGSFQAIQHKLANMALARERAWAAVYHAAMAIDAGEPERRQAAHVAKAQAAIAARLCAKDGIQIHGGIGFTWEHDLHLFLRRALSSEYLLGTSDWHLDQLGEALLGRAG